MADNNGAEIEDNEDSQEIEGGDFIDQEGQLSGEENTSSDEEETSWISWFVNIRGNDFFCEVEEDFIGDDFNLTGLSSQVPYYDYALDMILDIDVPIDALTEEQHELVETAAEVLYGLIHARYILTTAGINKMFEKYQNVEFGRCPRSLCQGQPVLPVGLSDITREFSVEVFCPRCHETYHPRSSKHANLDGAYFGTTFCHLFLLTHPEWIVAHTSEKYVPRIFGFRINENSQYYKLRDPNQSKRSKSSSNNANAAAAPAGGLSGIQQRAVPVNTNSPMPQNGINNGGGSSAPTMNNNFVSSQGATHTNNNTTLSMSPIGNTAPINSAPTTTNNQNRAATKNGAGVTANSKLLA